MKFSVFTASTPEWTPTEAVTKLAAQGWDGIEWRITDQVASDDAGFWVGNRATWPLTGLESNLDEIARITTGAGLAYSGIGGYAGSADHDNVERMLAATAQLGAERVRVAMPSPMLGSYHEHFASVRSDLEWIAGRAASHGVQALIELHHGTITSSASAALRLVDGLDPARIGVIHDLGNLVIEGREEHSAAFEILGPYLAHVHVKNVAWVADVPGGPDASSGSGSGASAGQLGPSQDGTVTWRADWATLRAGQADVFAYIAALVRHGYDGWVTLEDFSTELPLEERTADNLAYLRAAYENAVAAV
jgi:sugar phosphate isomerase/epimerase